MKKLIILSLIAVSLALASQSHAARRPVRVIVPPPAPTAESGLISNQ
jgi:hypothetical protein